MCMLAVGIRDNDNMVIEQFCNRSNKWRCIGEVPYNRVGCCGVLWNHQLVLLGGYDLNLRASSNKASDKRRRAIDFQLAEGPSEVL